MEGRIFQAGIFILGNGVTVRTAEHDLKGHRSIGTVCICTQPSCQHVRLTFSREMSSILLVPLI